MPTYVYRFVDTGETIEVQQAFNDDTLTEVTHPQSGQVMAVKKVFQPVGVTFRGSGFFKTDNRGKSGSGSNGASDGGGATSSERTKGETTKSETIKGDGGSSSSGSSSSESTRSGSATGGSSTPAATTKPSTPPPATSTSSGKQPD